MAKVNSWAVVAAAVAAFVAGASWSSPSLFGETNSEERGTSPAALVETNPPAGELLGEFARNPVIVVSLAQAVGRLGANDWKDAMEVGTWVRAGFQGQRLLSIVRQAEIPWRLCTLSAGAGLAKSLFAIVLAGAQRW